VPAGLRPPSWVLENVTNSELDTAICTKFGGQMHHSHAETRSRNWKLIRVMSSNERLEHKCVDLDQ